ncbi:MAG: hypothetical protein NTX55_02740, partial [Candidatus Parcubacteria bacterium]|nr:hypothetical protein [Candidatus Parcubacteria bacterium]
AGLKHLYNQVRELTSPLLPSPIRRGAGGEVYKEKFIETINDDFNIPKALAVAQELLKSNLSDDSKLATILDFDKVFGLDFIKLEKYKSEELEGLKKIPEDIEKLARELDDARLDKDFDKSDKIREKIKSLGFKVNYLENGGVMIGKDGYWYQPFYGYRRK